MIFETLPSIYAHALLDLTEKDSESVLLELGEVVRLLRADEKVGSFFASPLIRPESKVQAIEKSLRGKASPTLVNFLCVMASRGRLGEVERVHDVYRHYVNERLGRKSITVVTAVDADAASRSMIEKALEAHFKSKLSLTYEVDGSLIGGIVVKSEGREMDASILKHLRSIKAHMSARKIFGEKFYEN